MSRFCLSTLSRLLVRNRLASFNLKVIKLVIAPVIVAGFALSVAAKAEPVIVGVLSFDSLIPASGNSPGTNVFTIYNFTGSNSIPGSTPDSELDFLDTSLLLNGTQTVDLGEVDPGSVQLPAVQFPTTDVFTDADFSATLNTSFFDIQGQGFVATNDQVTADLSPSSPPDLIAGTDFVLLEIDANPASAPPVPEPASLWLVLGPVASLLWRRARRRS